MVDTHDVSLPAQELLIDLASSSATELGSIQALAVLKPSWAGLEPSWAASWVVQVPSWAVQVPSWAGERTGAVLRGDRLVVERMKESKATSLADHL